MTGELWAQTAESRRYVSTDHPAYHYIERLQLRGHLPSLSPLARPYRRDDVSIALDELTRATTASGLTELERDWLEALRRALGTRVADDRPALGLDLELGARASSTRRLDPLRPFGDAKAWPWIEAGVWLEAGPVTAVTRVRSDSYFPDDPDGEDVGRRLEARSEEAYVAARFAAGPLDAGLFLGRMSRGWGPAGSGLLISDNPASYPQLGAELAAGRFTLRAIVAELDTLGDDRRWLSAHQVELRLADNLRLAVAEAVVWAGPGAGPSPRMLNPLSFFFFDQVNEPEDFTPNLMGALQLWWRVDGAVVEAELVIDDFDYSDPLGGGLDAPPRYAARAGVRFPDLLGHAMLSLAYTQVSSFAYRTQQVVDGYLYLGRGLGANFADYDHLGIELELYPRIDGLVLTPALHIHRQGEGDPRTPIPSLGPIRVFLRSPALFLGTRTDTVRLALAGLYAPVAPVFVRWDVGVNFVDDDRHVAGRRVTRLAGTAEIGLRWSF